MVDIWMGDQPYKKAITSGGLKAVGPAVLTRDISSWLNPSMFADLP